jgi:hypothetical protein
MTQVLPQTLQIVIRSVQYRDLDTVERLYAEGLDVQTLDCSIDPDKPLKYLPPRPWNGLARALGLLLNPLQHSFCAYLAEQNNRIRGVIRVSPFNRTRSTWRVDRVAIDAHLASLRGADTDKSHADKRSTQDSSPEAEGASLATSVLGFADVGSQLLRHCFDTIWEARTWLLEVNINDKDALALYRETGFQPLAEMTYWEIAPELLQELAEREPDLPNLLPVSNADAQLLYQLDTASMPPLVRQVFDRHIFDFKTSLLKSLLDGLKNWLNHTEMVAGYVFEPQRKAAIGHFQLRLCRDGSQPHCAQLTVHPAYTWLYPELMAQMARITQDLPAQPLRLASSDYQPEREEYLTRIGATRIFHTLMMSRSVWHKLRETKPTALEGLQIPEMLQGLKPARKPVPSRLAPLRSVSQPIKVEGGKTAADSDPIAPQRNSKGLLKLPVSTDFSDPPQEGPCC